MDAEIRKVSLSYEVDNTDPSLGVSKSDASFTTTYVNQSFDIAAIALTFDISYITAAYDIRYLNITPTNIEVGLFLLKQSLLDYGFITDQPAFSVGKSLDDVATSTTIIRYSFNKPLSEAIVANDVPAKAFGTTRFDAFSATDQIDAFGLFKRNTDSGVLAVTTRIDTTKLLADNLYATDDLDGEASLEDDQNMFFFKRRSDNGYVYESNVKSFGTYRSDSASVADSGSLYGQDYVDNPFFFAEDYVGYSTTF